MKKIYGVTVGTPMSPEKIAEKIKPVSVQSDMAQTDPTQPDYVKNKYGDLVTRTGMVELFEATLGETYYEGLYFNSCSCNIPELAEGDVIKLGIKLADTSEFVYLDAAISKDLDVMGDTLLCSFNTSQSVMDIATNGFVKANSDLPCFIIQFDTEGISTISPEDYTYATIIAEKVGIVTEPIKLPNEALDCDDEVTVGSDKPVTSGGVHNAIEKVKESIDTSGKTHIVTAAANVPSGLTHNGTYNITSQSHTSTQINEMLNKGDNVILKLSLSGLSYILQYSGDSGGSDFVGVIYFRYVWYRLKVSIRNSNSVMSVAEDGKVATTDEASQDGNNPISSKGVYAALGSKEKLEFDLQVTANSNKLVTSGLIHSFVHHNYVSKSDKGQPNGTATLDADGKVPVEQLPEVNPGGGGELPDDVLTQEDLEGAINTALAQAKESGEFDGPQGDKGDKGDKGDDAEVTKENIETALGYTAADASLCVEDTTYPGCYYRMVGSVKEWLNPPMILGVPYRTTKRYDGKAVYTILQELGNLPSSGTSSVVLNTGNNILPDKYLSFQIIIKGSSSKRTYLGGTVVDNSGSPICRIGIEGTKTIEMRVYTDMSKYSGQIYAEYTIQE